MPFFPSTTRPRQAAARSEDKPWQSRRYSSTEAQKLKPFSSIRYNYVLPPPTNGTTRNGNSRGIAPGASFPPARSKRSAQHPAISKSICSTATVDPSGRSQFRQSCPATRRIASVSCSGPIKTECGLATQSPNHSANWSSSHTDLIPAKMPRERPRHSLSHMP
jgi:hypothetical protein